MATSDADINKFSVRIYNQARKGTPYHAGVPVDLANLLVAQARHETGNFSSSFFKKYNNAFGYAYYSGSNYQGAPGTNADNGQPIATYPSLEASVNEIVDWIYRRKNAGAFPADLATIKNPTQYATLLKNAGYYGDTLNNYLTGLMAYFKEILPGATGGNLASIAVVIGAAAYIFRKQLFG